MEDKIGVGNDPVLSDLILNAVNQVYAGIFIIQFQDRDHFELIWANKRHRDWFGEYMGDKEKEYPKGAFEGFLLKEDKKQFKKGYIHFLRNPGKPYRNIYKRTDGERSIWLFINAVVISHVKDHRPDKVIVVITDLSREIDAEVQLHRVLEQNSRVREKYKATQLTRRQKEVLGLILKGYTNKEMAEALHISLHTVDSHRKSLLAKFNIKNTAALVRLSLELGIDLQ